MTHKSAAKPLSRKHKLLRFLLRRRPCLYISICESITFIFLSICFFLCIYFYLSTRETRYRMDREDEELEKTGNYITFAHCNYKETSNSSFHQQYCGDRSRAEAFAWRHHELIDHTEEPTCVDRHEQVDCHEHISKAKFTVERINNFSACNGVRGILIPKSRYLSGKPSIKVKQPQINVTNYDKKILHSSEIFVQCPICEKVTGDFRWTNSDACIVKLSTMKYGWPAVAYECDDVIPSSSDHSCSLVISS